MVARSINITRETYLCILLDREHNGPVLIASPAGGMDIEAVAEETPEKIKTVPLSIDKPISESTLLEVAKFLEFKGDAVKRCAEEIQKLYTLFKAVDAVQIEINPLAETDKGEVISVDAKLNFDDNAQFRQKDIFAMDVTEEESDPREVEAPVVFCAPNVEASHVEHRQNKTAGHRGDHRDLGQWFLVCIFLHGYSDFYLTQVFHSM